MEATSDTPNDNNLITPLRAASRNLAREWGFLRPTIAGSNLSPAAVHALIELGDGSSPGMDELAAELRISRGQLKGVVVPELVGKGLIMAVVASGNGDDGERYDLTNEGRETLGEINAFAQGQVAKALEDVGNGNDVTAGDITSAFRIWTQALERTRQVGENVPSPAVTPGQEGGPFKLPEMAPAAATKVVGAKGMVEIVSGYLPGILGRTVEMHMDYYYPRYNWGKEFEMTFTEGMVDLLKRVGNGKGNQVWAAVLKQSEGKDRIVGTVYIDGESSGKEGVAKLRAFIVDEEARGLGAGKKLLRAAINFVKEEGFRGCELTTSKLLTVARRMYETEGFKPMGEFWYGGWLEGVCSMEYLWERPAGEGA
ncbi:acyl-CoA N-acyltransferase [Triangularia setosa]|uniref:Acyl-CoA N-acyltransferase n=1 Tax=Triangularia setosa TaxID=2587417 RepID=A0AAN7AC94_9PEZI|nr:acyl-CoA N-acyltransferase [Podospora setosa]